MPSRRLPLKSKRNKTQRRIRKWKLKGRMEMEEYRTFLKGKMPKEYIKDVQMEWGNYRTAFIETAEEICGTTSVEKNDKETRSWNYVIIQAVKRKNTAWRRKCKTRKDKDRQNYITEKKYCKKIIEKAKERALEEFTDRLAEDMKGNKKLFNRMM